MTCGNRWRHKICCMSNSHSSECNRQHRNQYQEGVQPFPSRANFILFRVDAACDVFESLKAQGVLIKNMGADTGPLAQCLRVTVGSAEENVAFLHALKKALA